MVGGAVAGRTVQGRQQAGEAGPQRGEPQLLLSAAATAVAAESATTRSQFLSSFESKTTAGLNFLLSAATTAVAAESLAGTLTGEFAATLESGRAGRRAGAFGVVLALCRRQCWRKSEVLLKLLSVIPAILQCRGSFDHLCAYPNTHAHRCAREHAKTYSTETPVSTASVAVAVLIQGEGRAPKPALIHPSVGQSGSCTNFVLWQSHKCSS